MARLRKPEPSADNTPPAWLFRFDFTEWDCPEFEHLTGAARWRAAYDRRNTAAKAWLEERDLLMWPHRYVPQGEWNRIRQEEPWRIVRRSPPTRGPAPP